MTDVDRDPDPWFLELQTALAGRYSLERELGRGGMGIVYLARDVSLDRPVAIKLLPPDRVQNAEVMNRFLREARTAARLSHPNIVAIHNVEQNGRLTYFVMTYVPGESLAARVRQSGPLPASEVARVLREVAWALDYAHQQGVVHRDVKADNILIDPHARRTLVADFGIAVVVGGQSEPVAGTVPYMSPEQALGTAADQRSDLYSLGVVGYFALSGRLPFPVTTIEQLLGSQSLGPAIPLATAAPHAPRALCRAIERCLALAPEQRWQSAGELAAALEQLAAGPSELPAPLRLWLTRDQRSRSALMLWSIMTVIPTAIVLVEGLTRLGPALGAAGVAVLFSLGPWAVYGVGRVLRTRKVLRAGYRHHDLLLAIRSHAERQQEELAFEIGPAPSRLGRLIRLGTWISVGAASVSFAGAAVFGAWFLGPAGLSFATMAIGGAVAGIFVPGRPMPDKNKPTWRERFWKGALGRAIVAVASWRLPRPAAPELTFHRPTEVALGDAADALFKALPAAQRADLAEVPEQLDALSRQAQYIRRQIDDLDDLIAQAAPSTLVDGSTASGDGGAGALASTRAMLAGQLQATVAMLETLRVGLLRLHAGSADSAALTVDLTAARELGAKLRRVSAAEQEISRFLKPLSGETPTAD